MSDLSSLDKDTANVEAGDDLFSREYFDPMLYINTNFRAMTISELNDVLINAKEQINAIKTKNQELVRKHFSKFVHCRESIEEIRENDVFSYLKSVFDQIEHNLASLKSKIETISTTHNIDLYTNNNNQKRRDIMAQYKNIFELEEKLKYDLKYSDYEGFVKHYMSALKLKSTSKYLNKKIEDAKTVKKQFLSILLAEIEKNVSTDDTLFYFSMYFKIEKSETSKMENTLLILIKKHLDEKYTLREMDDVLSYIFKNICITNTYFIREQIFIHLINWIKHRVGEETKILLFKKTIEKLHIFHDLLMNVLDKNSFSMVGNLLNGLYETIIQKTFIEVKNIFAYDIKHKTKRLEINIPIICDFINLNDIKENIYVIVSQLLEDIQCVKSMKSNISIATRYDFSELCSRHPNNAVGETNFQHCVYFLSIISKIRIKLQKIDVLIDNSLNFKRIDKIIKTCETKMLKNFIQNIENKSIECNLMVLSKLNELYPLNKDVLDSLNPEILKCKVSLFFLSNILETNEPKLDNHERKKVDDIYDQFCHLKTI